MKLADIYTNQRVINRYINQYKIDNVNAELHFKALLDFLHLAATTNKPCFPNKAIDDIWHTFILFTKDYYTFCSSNFGKIVHHYPFVSEEEKQKSFSPGYFCYISENKMKKKLVKSVLELDSQYVLSADFNCGSGGDCSNTDSCSN